MDDKLRIYPNNITWNELSKSELPIVILTLLKPCEYELLTQSGIKCEKVYNKFSRVYNPNPPINAPFSWHQIKLNADEDLVIFNMVWGNE